MIITKVKKTEFLNNKLIYVSMMLRVNKLLIITITGQHRDRDRVRKISAI